MHWYELELTWKKNYVKALIVWDFIKEHDRFIREFPTFKQQQELNWAYIQSFRTLCSKVAEIIHHQLFDKDFKKKSVENNKNISDIEITDAIELLENLNAYLHSIEALMEKIFDIKVVKNVEVEFKKISKKLAPDPLNIDRLILNRLLHQIPDLPDNNNFK